MLEAAEEQHSINMGGRLKARDEERHKKTIEYYKKNCL
jgi:hypothetical protein